MQMRNRFWDSVGFIKDLPYLHLQLPTSLIVTIADMLYTYLSFFPLSISYIHVYICSSEVFDTANSD